MQVLNNYLNAIAAQIINPLMMLIAGAAFVVFLWGAFVFISHADDDTKRKEGRDGMLWGFVGLVIIFGAYGIINIALRSFGLGTI
jgi:hypothetical protein